MEEEARMHPFTVISVMGTEEYPTLHDIQQNSAWSENPYGETYALVPDDMVDEVMSIGCWCNITVEDCVLTSITKVEPPKPKPEPEPEPTEVHLTREDFDLLDVTYSATTYHIVEDDNTITIMRGED